MSNLVIDIGNTRYKLGFFNNEELTDFYEATEWDTLLPYINLVKPQQCIISSVRKDIESIESSLLSYFSKIITLTHKTPVPVKNLYETPHTLGMDRLAGVVGAKVFFPDLPCLIIDAGTCITYDFIDAQATYHGGTIAPGINMRLKSMHTFTSKLPLLDWDNSMNLPSLTGKSTQEAMLSGAVNGVLAEIEGIISFYEEKHKKLQVIICGGDTSFFESTIKHPIFAISKLVLFGLNRILEYNVRQKT